MTVREMLERIDSRELSEWMAFDSLEPIGDLRGDYQAGVIASVVANSTPRKRGAKIFQPADFMVYGRENDEKRTKRKSPAAMRSALHAWLASLAQSKGGG